MQPLRTLTLGSLLALSSVAAHAALVNVTFSGTVLPGAYDLSSAIYGQGVSGQVGDTISGSFFINTAQLLDSNANPNIGIWGPATNPFPQPFSALAGSYTVDGVTIQTGQHLAQPSGHSVEDAWVYDINTGVAGQDYLRLQDRSQHTTANSGSLADSYLIINIFGNLNWLQNPTLEQSFNLNAANIAAIVNAGGAASGEYGHWRVNESRTAYVYDARGEFSLTSLSFAPVPEQPSPNPVPEPANSLTLLGLALAGLLATRGRAAA
jgi:hypothetical protein